jgi:hypothetical protein
MSIAHVGRLLAIRGTGRRLRAANGNVDNVLSVFPQVRNVFVDIDDNNEDDYDDDDKHDDDKHDDDNNDASCDEPYAIIIDDNDDNNDEITVVIVIIDTNRCDIDADGDAIEFIERQRDDAVHSHLVNVDARWQR